MAATKYAIGVDLGGTTIKIGIVSDKGKIIKKVVVDTLAEEGYKKVIKQIKKGISEVLSKNKKTIEGIGIGSPGLVIRKKGTVENPPNFPGWKKVQLGKIISEEFPYKTYVENDANAAAVGEQIFGAGKRHDSFIMVTLGTGVGGGIIFERKVFAGETGGAGELGHLSIDLNANQCKCGNVGCVESYAGINYLCNSVKRQMEKNPDSLIVKWVNEENKTLEPKLIHEAAEEGDPFALDVIHTLGINIGAGLTSIVNVLDIATIIMGGGVAGFGDRLFDTIETTIKERVLTPHRTRIKLKQAKLKNDAGIMGASALVFQ